MISPNPIAFAMLALTPVLVWQLYRRLDRVEALIWTVLGAYMLLPELVAFDLPLIPAMDKDTLPGLSALVIVLVALRDRLPFWPDSVIGKMLVLFFVAAPFATVVTNPDPILVANGDHIPGMRIYDSASAVANAALFILPMVLARHYLATPQALATLIRCLALAGLIYSVPMAFESRFSPQLHTWIYGFFQHDFGQQIRFGGFRPVVFMPHGLWTAFFALMAFLACAWGLRLGPAEMRPKALLALAWMGVILILCKSFGPVAYAMLGLPLILLTPVRLQIWVTLAIALVVITYPLLRGLHLVPIWEILDVVRGINAEKAWSLEFRLTNEELLLARASERPWFGWGGYGRNFIRDLITGRLVTVADGHWVIQIGTWGWLGYLAEFGLLSWPLVLLWRETLSRGAAIAPEVGVVAVIFALNLVDLLPNATIVPFTWLMAGAIWGHAEQLRRQRLLRSRAEVVEAVMPRPSRTVI